MDHWSVRYVQEAPRSGYMGQGAWASNAHHGLVMWALGMSSGERSTAMGQMQQRQQWAVTSGEPRAGRVSVVVALLGGARLRLRRPMLGLLGGALGLRLVLPMLQPEGGSCTDQTFNCVRSRGSELAA